MDTAEQETSETERRRMILVVDDEAGIRTVLRLALTHAGYDVVEAEDGEQALERIAEVLPDLVLLDVMMPGLGGFAVCESLREDPRTADLPVIMLSARTDSRSRQAGLRAGATKYLTKPLASDLLLLHVADALGSAVS